MIRATILTIDGEERELIGDRAAVDPSGEWWVMLQGDMQNEKPTAAIPRENIFMVTYEDVVEEPEPKLEYTH